MPARRVRGGRAGKRARRRLRPEPRRSVPLDLRFRDETGQEVRFGELLRGRPVVLSLVYYDCPMLCTLVLNGVARRLKPLSLNAGDRLRRHLGLLRPHRDARAARRARRPPTSSA